MKHCKFMCFVLSVSLSIDKDKQNKFKISAGMN